jgi:FdhD protein
MHPSKKFTITEYRDGSFSEISDTVASEKKLRIFAHDKEILSLLCTPTMVKELVIGFALSEGLLNDPNKPDLQKEWCSERIEVLWKEEEIEVRLPVDLPEMSATMTSGCAKGITFISDMSENNLPVIMDDTSINSKTLIELYKQFQKRSSLFKDTGGVHSAALCDSREIIVFTEDIGRHNAVDKIIGYAFLENISLKGKILLLSGRLSSEITVKAIRAPVSILVSRAAPTDRSIEIARNAGLTIVGFLRGNGMNIYSKPERILMDNA